VTYFTFIEEGLKTELLLLLLLLLLLFLNPHERSRLKI